MPRRSYAEEPELITPAPDPDRFQCRHILTGGHRCGSPCLRNEDFCYYHHSTRRPAPRNGACHGAITPRKHSTLDLPLPEDRSAIQHSIGEVLRAIATGEIDPRRAGLLLYGLQIASHNLPREQAPIHPANTVEEVTEDPTEGLLAPRANFQQAAREKTLEEIIVAQWEQEKVEAQLQQDQDFARKQGEGPLIDPEPAANTSPGHPFQPSPRTEMICLLTPATPAL